MRHKGTTTQLKVRCRVAVSLLEVGWGVQHVARQVQASPVPFDTGGMPLPSRRRRASPPHPIPVGVTPNSLRNKASVSSTCFAKGPAPKACATHAGRWRGACQSLNATSAAPLAPPAPGICCGIWAGAPRNPPRGPMSGMKRPWPTGPRPKKAPPEGRTRVCIDAPGFMLQPTVRRTWAPRGDTPGHHRWERHARLSVPGAITVSPVHKRVGFSFSMRPQTW
jgi:hypothetical protein